MSFNYMYNFVSVSLFFLQRFTRTFEGPVHTPHVPSLVEISKTTAETSRFTGFHNHRLGNPMRQLGVRVVML